MELRDFANRVLFADSLEEKLGFIAGLTDDEPGMALASPSEPGRPSDLVMRKVKTRPPFPGDSHLVDSRQRGVLLHFFANHELLATELMALVLLKFPSAPKAFRRGILNTLKEEQEHTRWYLQRMRECGVAFGEYPLNRFFWDAIAPMETPMDFVSRLSLTFEQANLDYACHYEKVLREAGDSESAAILGRIYRDEIAHVGHGLKWFRRWKEEQESDWEAYRRSLRFPLSPSRGKGNVKFNTEGRLQAGLSMDFVREMHMFQMSKGRTPNLFHFLPHAEADIAAELSGSRFQPGKAAQELADDLEILPVFLSRQDDVVLMKNPPSLEERERLSVLGFGLPEFEQLDGNGNLAKGSPLLTRKWNQIRPWAWTPATHRLYAPLLGKSDGSNVWNRERASLYSKAFALQMRRSISDAEPVARACNNLGEVDATIQEIRGGAGGGIYLKAALGAAGQKNRRLPPNEPLEGSFRRWVERLLGTGQPVIVEPWLDRVHDFSVQYEFESGTLRRVAMVHLFNDGRGQFQACEWGPKFGSRLAPEIASFLMGNRDLHQANAISIYDEIIPACLTPELKARGHTGPIGIDAMVHRSPDGTLQLQAIVEINPRYTMGRLTWELAQQVAPGKSIRFELISAASAKLAGFDRLADWGKDWQVRHPARWNAQGKLLSGAVVLNDLNSARRILAVLEVL